MFLIVRRCTHKHTSPERSLPIACCVHHSVWRRRSVPCALSLSLSLQATRDQVDLEFLVTTRSSHLETSITRATCREIKQKAFQRKNSKRRTRRTIAACCTTDEPGSCSHYRQLTCFRSTRIASHVSRFPFPFRFDFMVLCSAVFCTANAMLHLLLLVPERRN